MEFIDSLVLDIFGIQSIVILAFYVIAIYDIFNIDTPDPRELTHLKNVGYGLLFYPLLLVVIFSMSIYFSWGAMMNDSIIFTLFFLLPYAMILYYAIDRYSRSRSLS